MLCEEDTVIILDGDVGTFQVCNDGRGSTWFLSDGPCCCFVVQNLMSMSQGELSSLIG